MLSFIDLAKTLIKAVKSRNEADPDVKTADETVFKRMEEAAEDINKNADTSTENSRAEAYREMRRRMENVRRENEADPDIETADASVFDEMQRKIEELNRKIEEQQRQQEQPQHNPQQSGQTTSDYQFPYETRAMTNSMGGSLEIRTSPSMGASKMDVRIPDNSMVQILQYSDQSIMLDGRKSTFVFVDYNGTQGWILDSYLNRN